MENVDLAKALFAAFASGDADAARSLCSLDLQATQNHGPPMGLDALLDFSQAVQGVVENFRYENAVRTETANGFVEEHSVRGKLADGTEMKLAACVVAEVRQGKIVDLREYADGAAARGLVKALSSAAGL